MMKKILFIAFYSFLFISCAPNKEDLFQGKWKFHSSVDVEKNKTIMTVADAEDEDNQLTFVHIDKRTLKIQDRNQNVMDEEYRWTFFEDSIRLHDIKNERTFFVYLKTLTADRLEVELDFLGRTRLIFDRVKDEIK